MENPVDTGIIGTRVIRKNAISLASLLNESVELHHSINRSHLNLQNFQIITPKNGSNTSTMRYQLGRPPQKINFFRIIICRYEKSLCYIMINNDHNRSLFHRYLLLRDNGTVTIGTFMRIIVPYPIIQ